MSEIKIERNHTLGETGVKQRLADIEPKLKERYGVTLSWQGNRAKVSGTAVSGHVDVGSERLAIQLKLGFMARPFAGRIREALERQIDKALG